MEPHRRRGPPRARAASARQAGMGRIVEAWPERVGEPIAAQRLAGADRPRRDAARRDARSSAWAFELGQLEATILRAPAASARRRRAAGAPLRSGPASGAGSPPAPETARRAAAGARSGACARPRAIAGAAIEDDELRELVARAAAASLAGPLPTARSDRLLEPGSRLICRAFFMTEAHLHRKRHHRPRGPRAGPARPGMYIGSTGARGLHHLVYEVVDNSVDEALAGRNDRIEVTLHPDNSVTVRDNGSGIPVDVMADQGLPALDGRADEAARRRQVRRRGLQGLRRPARRRRLGRQRALRVARRRGAPRRQDLPAGVRARRARKADMEVVGKRERRPARRSRSCPTREIFEEIDWSRRDARPAPARDRVPDARPARSCSPTSARATIAYEFHYEGGIRDFVAHVNEAEGPDPQAHRLLRGRDRAAAPSRSRCSGTRSYVESVFSFANNINTHEGGSHLSGFNAALTRTLNKYAREQGPAEGEGGRTSRARTCARGSPPSSR